MLLSCNDCYNVLSEQASEENGSIWNRKMESDQRETKEFSGTQWQ